MTATECESCKGTGWIHVDRHGLSAVERCSCVYENRAERYESAAGIPPLYQDASLENFILPNDNLHARNALSQVQNDVRRYIRDYPNPEKPGLLFIGETGTGKTHLAAAVLRAILKRGFQGVFFDYQNLLDRIRSGYDSASGATDKEAYRVALDAQVLLLDDLGAHRDSDWVLDIVTAIVTYRCNHRLTLIATTNLPDPDAGDKLAERSLTAPGKTDYRVSLAERIGSRARSRLFEMCRIVRMPAIRDYRIRRK